MKKLINVTQEDIDAGIQSSCHSCPNAKALTRALDEPCGFGYDDWWKRHDPDHLSRSAPKEALDFARSFDIGDPVAPYSFEVEV